MIERQMSNQILLHPAEIVLAPGLQQCQRDITKLRMHIPGKLGRIKGMNCRLYHNIKSSFNRVHILLSGKRLGLPVYGIVGG